SMDTGAKRGGNVLMSDPSVRFDPKVIPAEIKRWNWGAFLLNWIWGIGNQTYIALLALIPGFGFIWSWYLAPRAAPGPGATGAGTASSISNACSASGRSGAPSSGSPCRRYSAPASAASFSD